MKTAMKVLSAALTTGAMFASVSANAVTVDLFDLTPSWQNTVGGAGVSASSGDPAKLQWGTGGNKSSYSFNTSDGFFPWNPDLSFVVPPSPTASKSLGTFTHDNQSINAGSSITSTQLKLTTAIKVDGTNLGNFDFVFDIFHNETPNSGNNCCADIVTFGNAAQSQVFSYGGVNYTLYLTGFGDSANDLTTTFSSREDRSNSVKLWGYIGTAPAVPEPSTWMMMIGGLGLVGVAMRRRKTSVSFA